MSRKTLYISASVYFIIIIGFMTAPVSVKLINRIYPYILGFPFFQFCIFLFVVLTSAGLTALFFLEDRLEKRGTR